MNRARVVPETQEASTRQKQELYGMGKTELAHGVLNAEVKKYLHYRITVFGGLKMRPPPPPPPPPKRPA